MTEERIKEWLETHEPTVDDVTELIRTAADEAKREGVEAMQNGVKGDFKLFGVEKIWDFDHIDGDSSNNSLSNCQALCPNCHAKKTRKTKKRDITLSQILRKIKRYLR